MDSGHIAWILTASALVLLMTPGLAFFYGGLVRARNSISTIMYSFISMAVVSIVWVLWGYSLAFGGGNAFIGNLDHFGLSGIAIDDLYPGTGIPTLLFVVFQMMFAIITPALITARATPAAWFRLAQLAAPQGDFAQTTGADNY